MPRKNSTNWSVADQVSATRLQDFNEDLDDIYSNGSDRFFCYKSAALQVTIGAGTFRVGNTEGIYAGGTVTVTDNATTYIMLNTSGVIQTSTSAWNGNYARIAKVVAASGTITSVEIWRADLVGGPVGTKTVLNRQYFTFNATAGNQNVTLTFAGMSTIDYLTFFGSIGKDTSYGNARVGTSHGYFPAGGTGTCSYRAGYGDTSGTYSDRTLFCRNQSTTGGLVDVYILNSSISITGNQVSFTATVSSTAYSNLLEIAVDAYGI